MNLIGVGLALAITLMFALAVVLVFALAHVFANYLKLGLQLQLADKPPLKTNMPSSTVIIDITSAIN